MLKNNGFEVIDLGKDVSHEELIEAARITARTSWAFQPL